MTNLTRFALIAIAALCSSTSIAEAKGGHYVGGFGNFPGVWIPNSSGNGGSSAGGGNNSDPAPQRTIKLACIVGGTPVELPNDLWITNTTTATLVKGTALTFVVPSIGVKGSFLLPSNVAPGTQVKIADLFGGAPAGAPCAIKMI